MRGGSWPPLIFACMLGASAAINSVWTKGRLEIQPLMFLWAIVVLASLAGILVAVSREAIKRGPPGPDVGRTAVPAASLAAMIAGLSLGSFVFGYSFGRFPIVLGGALFIACLCRLAYELRAQRIAVRDGVSDPAPDAGTEEEQ